MGEDNLDMNMQQDVDITDELMDDLLLRSFGLSENYVENKDLQMTDLKEVFMPCEEVNQKPVLHQGVIIKNNFVRGTNATTFPTSAMPSNVSMAESTEIPLTSAPNGLIQNCFNSQLQKPQGVRLNI